MSIADVPQGSQPTAGGTSLFAITARPPTVQIIPGETHEVVFTVSFAGVPAAAPIAGAAPAAGTAIPSFAAHAHVVPREPAAAAWYQLDGEASRRFAPNSTEQYTVRIAAPADAAPGAYAFRLDMIGDDNPDEAYTEGPSVAVTLAPAPVAKKKPPFWLWIIIAAVVLLVGGIATTVALSHRGQAPTPTPTLDTTPPAVSGVTFAPVDKNNVRITFALNESGRARVRYGTSADLASGTTLDATDGGNSTFQATLGVNRETQYFYQITAADRAGNSAPTLVRQFRLNRTLTVTLVSVTVPVAPVICTSTQSFTESLDYATAPSAKKTFTVSMSYPGGTAVPPDHPLNHPETIAEDPARQIALTMDIGYSVTACFPGGSASGSVTHLVAMLTPASDWGIGLPPQTVMSGTFKMTYTVADSLTVI